MDREFNRGDEVFVRDYPYGKPLNIFGKVVGFLPDDCYNVMLGNGLNAGKITKYRSWSLIRKKDVRRMENGCGLSLEE
tara:strand:- start:60 stop:293 length:234 start_codon:yes stop_codon:yes gene_type:complete